MAPPSRKTGAAWTNRLNDPRKISQHGPRQNKSDMEQRTHGGAQSVEGTLSSGYAAINFFVINCMSKWAEIFLNFHHLPSCSSMGNQARRGLWTMLCSHTQVWPTSRTLENHGHQVASGRALSGLYLAIQVHKRFWCYYLACLARAATYIRTRCNSP